MNTGEVEQSPHRFDIAAGVAVAVLATANLYVPDLGGGRLADPTTIALGLCLLLALWAWRSDRFRLGAAHLVLAVVVVSFLPALAMAADHTYGRTKVFGLLATFAITAIALQLLGASRARAAFLWAVGVSGAVVAVALLLFGESATFYGQWSIFDINPISLGRMTALGALLALLAAPRARGHRLAALVVVALACVVATYLTSSRGPAVAIVAALVVAASAGRRLPVSRPVVLTGASAVVAGLVALLASGAVDTSGRGLLWRESLVLALEHPFGVGLGDLYGKVTLHYYEVSADHRHYSHNVLIEAAVEGGWIALAGLLLALVVSFRRLYRDADMWAGRAILAVWVYAVVNACLSSDLVGNRLMWVMVGAGLALELRRQPALSPTRQRARRSSLLRSP